MSTKRRVRPVPEIKEETIKELVQLLEERQRIQDRIDQLRKTLPQKRSRDTDHKNSKPDTASSAADTEPPAKLVGKCERRQQRRRADEKEVAAAAAALQDDMSAVAKRHAVLQRRWLAVYSEEGDETEQSLVATATHERTSATKYVDGLYYLVKHGRHVWFSAIQVQRLCAARDDDDNTIGRQRLDNFVEGYKRRIARVVIEGGISLFGRHAPELDDTLAAIGDQIRADPDMPQEAKVQLVSDALAGQLEVIAVDDQTRPLLRPLGCTSPKARSCLLMRYPLVRLVLSGFLDKTEEQLDRQSLEEKDWPYQQQLHLADLEAALDRIHDDLPDASDLKHHLDGDWADADLLDAAVFDLNSVSDATTSASGSGGDDEDRLSDDSIGVPCSPPAAAPFDFDDNTSGEDLWSMCTETTHVSETDTE